jgi:hypothetical protein
MILKAGLIYFAIVFGAGFVLGTIRTLWVVPRLGTRMAELMETPIMLAGRNTCGALDSSAFSHTVYTVGPANDGWHRACLPDRRGVRTCALASSSFHKRIRGNPRPCVENCLLLGACAICHHATVRG